MRPLEDRLRHSKADLIAVRRINVLFNQYYILDTSNIQNERECFKICKGINKR